MLRGWYSRCLHFGILCLCLGLCGVDGLIEIVEEQQCHDYTFRLTCRGMDSHIAILEAWYTSIQNYNTETNQTVQIKIKTENDSELNRVYIYSSPKHNGVYESVNSSLFEIDNVTSVNNSWTFSNESEFLNDTVEVPVEGVVEDCGVVPFTRSYASWRHEGDKRRRPVSRDKAVNLRAPLSYRCMGVNHCSFILRKDYAPSVSWSPGVVYIKYACFDDFLSIHYCNLDVDVAESGPESEGYLRTPGYPNFYVGGECRWKIQAGLEQRVRVTLIDVSLRDIGPFETNCTDFITVKDGNGNSLLTSCDQVDLPMRLTSTTNAVDLVFRAGSKGAYPARGLLLHYKSVGCVTLPEPSDGYLVYRNEDVAHYMCNVNFVFVDTRQRARLIWCFDDNRWNDTVPLCVEETATAAAGNDSAPGSGENAKLPHNEANVMVDIVIPSLLIAALFIGNAFIVLIIYKYRKRKNDDLEDEFNTIPLSVNGNIHSAGNAV